jgi:D-serine deaminase-like pyridoxal phosphate-dependent protein
MRLPAPASPGQSLADVDTPACLLDLDAFERNLGTMTDAVRPFNVRLRPHAKSHKCAEIARRQIAAGAVGVCVQKTSEAEALVAGGVADVLIANEVVGRGKLARVAALGKSAQIGVCVDDAAVVAELDEVARAAGSRLDVYVEVNVGANRCGVEPGAPALRLARIVSGSANLRFAGLQAYHGAAQHLRTVEERRVAIAQAVDKAGRTRRLIEKDEGLACDIVTGAGTGTFIYEGTSGVYDELQPGSYAFMDADYNRNSWEGFPRFEQSLFICSTVMSAPTPERVVVDELKAHSFDSGMPQVVGWSGVEYARPSDEHGVLKVAAGARAPRLGEKIRLVPGHCDPTVNLYDWLVCYRGERVEAVWLVTARRVLLSAPHPVFCWIGGPLSIRAASERPIGVSSRTGKRRHAPPRSPDLPVRRSAAPIRSAVRPIVHRREPVS